MLDQPESRDPEDTFSTGEEKAIAVALTITTQVGANRSIVLQTYLPRDAPIGEFHSAMDKLTKTVDRQEAKVQLEALESELRTLQKTRLNMISDFQGIEARAEAAWGAREKRGAFKLSANEEAQKGTAKTNIARYDSEIKKTEELISKARGVIHDVD